MEPSQLLVGSEVIPDALIVPPPASPSRTRGLRGGSGPRAPRLTELVEQFCHYQGKQRGRTEGGVQAYRWTLQRFVQFVQDRDGRVPRLRDLTEGTIQTWMDDMAMDDLAINTLRTRQAALSSFCNWLVKRKLLVANPILSMDRPPCQRVQPVVPRPALMDALVKAAKEGGKLRDLAIFLLLRYTGMRREAVATLRLKHLDPAWGLRAVRVKGGKPLDVPVPDAVMRFLEKYVAEVLVPELNPLTPETSLFWSRWGQRRVGMVRRPMTGKNIWRLCKVYGRRIGYPTLKPHDLRHGVAVEVLGQRNNLKEVRALLGHARIDTTQIYTTIQPPQLRRAVAFYEDQAKQLLDGLGDCLFLEPGGAD